MFERLEKIIKKYFWVPFILGFIGYYFMDGGADGTRLGVAEAMYASAALYFVNPVCENANVAILCAEILSMIVTAEFVLTVLKGVSSAFNTLVNSVTNIYKDSTVVYTDTEFGEKFANSCRHGYQGRGDLSGTEKNAKDYIVMYGDDEKNLEFYEKHRKFFFETGKRLFIALNHVDSTMLRCSDDKNVHFFCIDEIISRDFWRKFDLYSEINGSHNSQEKDTDTLDASYKIAFIGFGTMGRALFKQAYLNNIYSVGQRIEYHIWGCPVSEKHFVESLCDKTCNNDRIILHDTDYTEETELMLSMNRVIVTVGDTIDVVQNLIRINGKYQVFFHNESGHDFSAYFDTKNLYMFGNVEELLTEEKIKTERLFLQAKLTGYDYELRRLGASTDSLIPGYEKDMDELWSRRSGFIKNSNITRADYLRIENRNSENKVPIEQLWEMEHVVWCRYYYYHGWTLGEKNAAARTHCDLVPFSELSLESKEKDGIYNDEIRKKLMELDVSEQS